MTLAFEPLPTRPATPVWTLVTCTGDGDHPGCGRTFSLKPRAARALAAGDRSPLCRWCRYGVTMLVTDEERQFWLDRFTAVEIREMGRALDMLCPGDWRAGFTFTLPGEVEAA